ncbi:GntR family transcriptional regulator [Sphingobium boeckii]|uniref:DNA-binding GntR family transcriptional regulator n=1 Tax=Sphingobium boeckii TaxID=1082345 RepID=A0A7W9AGU3_9SPHN|nr:GntR family transcriptional regulator [Sphingobium boeckii]MBB5685450.1 DNA-binding GntR family transcriptional regulator [Sphingobium boeckii]
MSKASDRAYEQIRAKILSGEFSPGSQLKEEEVAEICGVSRTPVRDAMSRLENEMFIYRTESQRSFVSEWSGGDVEEIFTLRTMLERHASSRAAERASEAMIANLRANNAAIAEAIRQPVPDVDAFLQLNRLYHAMILEAAASDRLAMMLNRLVLQPIVHRTALRYDRAQLERSLAEHEEIVAAIARRDPDWAGAVMTSHIRRAYHVYMNQNGITPEGF